MAHSITLGYPINVNATNYKNVLREVGGLFKKAGGLETSVAGGTVAIPTGGGLSLPGSYDGTGVADGVFPRPGVSDGARVDEREREEKVGGGIKQKRKRSLPARLGQGLGAVILGTYLLVPTLNAVNDWCRSAYAFPRSFPTTGGISNKKLESFLAEAEITQDSLNFDLTEHNFLIFAGNPSERGFRGTMRNNNISLWVNHENAPPKQLLVHEILHSNYEGYSQEQKEKFKGCLVRYVERVKGYLSIANPFSRRNLSAFLLEDNDFNIQQPSTLFEDLDEAHSALGQQYSHYNMLRKEAQKNNRSCNPLIREYLELWDDFYGEEVFNKKGPSIKIPSSNVKQITWESGFIPTAQKYFKAWNKAISGTIFPSSQSSLPVSNPPS